MKRHRHFFVIVALLVLACLDAPANAQNNSNIGSDISSSGPEWKPLALSNHSPTLFCLIYDDALRKLGVNIKQFDGNKVAVELVAGRSAEGLKAFVEGFDKLNQPIRMFINQAGEIRISTHGGGNTDQLSLETLNKLFTGREKVILETDGRLKAKRLAEIVDKFNALKVLEVRKFEQPVVVRAPAATGPAGVNPPIIVHRNADPTTLPGTAPPQTRPDRPNIAPRLAEPPPQLEVAPSPPGLAFPTGTSVSSPQVTPTRPQTPNVDKKHLRRAVEAAFDTRQQRQRAELQRLRQRLSTIEKSIATRERNKEKIIQHRVAELLDPNLRWENGSAAGPPVSVD